MAVRFSGEVRVSVLFWGVFFVRYRRRNLAVNYGTLSFIAPWKEGHGAKIMLHSHNYGKWWYSTKRGYGKVLVNPARRLCPIMETSHNLPPVIIIIHFFWYKKHVAHPNKDMSLCFQWPPSPLSFTTKRESRYPFKPQWHPTSTPCRW